MSNDTERLDWVLRKAPRFEDDCLVIWLGSCEASDMGLNGCGYYLADGSNKREQIDNAMAGKLEFIG